MKFKLIEGKNYVTKLAGSKKVQDAIATNQQYFDVNRQISARRSMIIFSVADKLEIETANN
jgi:hypothetical protein